MRSLSLVSSVKFNWVGKELMLNYAFSEFTSKQVSDNNSELVTEFFRLLKKYQAIRTIVRILVVSIFSLTPD